MANTKKVTSKGKTPAAKANAKGPGVVKVRIPLGRTGSPAFLNPPVKHSHFRLEPASKIHAPVLVWGHRTEHGWTGWLETNRATQILPTHWSKDRWNELPAVVEVSIEVVRAMAAGGVVGK